ncbi:MAG: hypothetical protein KAX45_10025 [Chitinophagaceae bacterium]|nr:hypothetical protein [Chitinophagaceae bacterium]MBP6589614.1 hypothetical protein [Chitinophagaceae bacterium]MBP8244866.1 hypothetical protein [Chitinophagaceae bacterium]
MKKLIIGFLSFITLAASAQTADEIVQKYAAAMGGLDAFKKVQTAKFTGSVSVQGNDLPMTMQVINNRAVRSDIDVMGTAVTNSYKDGKGWKLNPFAGIETATDMEAAELNDIRGLASLASPLMDYKNQGHTVELIGQEDVDGVKTFKLKLTAKEDGRVTIYFISAADSHIIKASSKRMMQGAEAEVETYFSEVKEFGGLKFAMNRTQKMNGNVFQSIQYNNIELNVKIAETVFDK